MYKKFNKIKYYYRKENGEPIYQIEKIKFDTIRKLFDSTKRTVISNSEAYRKAIANKEEIEREQGYFLLHSDCYKLYLSVYHLCDFITDRIYDRENNRENIYCSTPNPYFVDKYYTINYLKNIKNKIKNKKYIDEIIDIISSINNIYFSTFSIDYENFKIFDITYEKIISLNINTVDKLEKLWDIVEKYLKLNSLFY